MKDVVNSILREEGDYWEHVSGGNTTGEILKHRTRENLYMIRTDHMGCFDVYMPENGIKKILGKIKNGVLV